MHAVIKLYRLINILSLDIAGGAVISALFFAELLDVQILSYGLAALGLTVWIVYTADHLLDAKSIRGEASSERHRFHQIYFQPLFMLTIVALLLDFMMIFFIRQQVFQWGAVLGAMVIIYLIVQRYLKFLKEIFVAVLYTAGVLLPSVTVTNISITPFQIVLMIQFGIIALINLLLFSWFDSDSDNKDLQQSFVTIMGKAFTAKCIMFLTVINFIPGIFLFPQDPRAVIIFWLMNSVLLLIYTFRNQLQRYEHYRLAGDAVFLMLTFYWLS